MADNLNVWCGVGNLVRDPEQKSEQFTVCRIAVNSRKKVGDEYADVPFFIDVLVIGKDAKFIAEYGAKGRQVSVQGQLDIDEYEDKEGNKRQSPQIRSFGGVNLIGPKPEASDAPSGDAAPSSWDV